MPRTVQLRRYALKPHLVDAFLEWWPARLIPAREATGFRVEFGYFEPTSGEFTWAVSVEGDAEEFARVEAAYMSSPERAAAFTDLPEPSWMTDHWISLVDTVLPAQRD